MTIPLVHRSRCSWLTWAAAFVVFVLVLLIDAMTVFAIPQMQQGNVTAITTTAATAATASTTVGVTEVIPNGFDESHVFQHDKFLRAMSGTTITKRPLEYIVRFQPSLDGDDDPQTTLALVDEFQNQIADLEVMHIYTNVLQGFSIRVPLHRVPLLLNHDDVLSVEENLVFPLDRINEPAVMMQTGPPWGLDRMDQRSLPLDQQYRYEYTGRGVDVYVLDSGMRISHDEFGGRAVCDGDYIDGDGTSMQNYTTGHGIIASGSLGGYQSYLSYPCQDDDGHGTMVAGLIGGATYGAAKECNLHSMKVCDVDGCRGAAILAALDDIISTGAPPTKIVNLSIVGDYWSTINDAVTNAVQQGVFVVVAAGNDNADACQTSPASAALAFTVGATTVDDAKANFSNFGSCVELWAPGVALESASASADNATDIESGTSMAAPLVAGVAAMYLERLSNLTPAELTTLLQLDASKDKLSGLQTDSPNLLLYALETYITEFPTAPSDSPTIGNEECSFVPDTPCTGQSDCCDGLVCVNPAPQGVCEPRPDARAFSLRRCPAASVGAACSINLECCFGYWCNVQADQGMVCQLTASNGSSSRSYPSFGDRFNGRSRLEASGSSMNSSAANNRPLSPNTSNNISIHTDTVQSVEKDSPPTQSSRSPSRLIDMIFGFLQQP